VERLNYSIHEFIKIELINPSEETNRFFEAQLKYFHSSLVEAPNLSINFVDRLPSRGTLRYVGGSAAYDDKNFYLIDRFGHMATLPMERFPEDGIGIVAECKIHSMDLYRYIIIPILRSQLLRHGMAFLHASSLYFMGKGILITGWAGSGKTNLLLSLMEEGGRYMGDDLSILSEKGTIYAYPEPLSLYDENLWYFRKIANGPGISKKRDLFVKRTFDRIYGLIYPRMRRNSTTARMLARLKDLSKELSAQEMIPDKIEKICPLDICIFLTRTNQGKLEIVEREKEAFVEMIMANLAFEFSYIRRYLLMYESAFRKDSTSIKETECRERQILEKAFDGRKLYEILIPDTFDWKGVYGSIKEYLIK
jgi:hypothetical protein